MRRFGNTLVYDEQPGNERAKARFEARASAEVLAEQERFMMEQKAARYLVADMRLRRYIDSLSRS